MKELCDEMISVEEHTRLHMEIETFAPDHVTDQEVSDHSDTAGDHRYLVFSFSKLCTVTSTW